MGEVTVAEANQYVIDHVPSATQSLWLLQRENGREEEVVIVMVRGYSPSESGGDPLGVRVVSVLEPTHYDRSPSWLNRVIPSYPYTLSSEVFLKLVRSGQLSRLEEHR